MTNSERTIVIRTSKPIDLAASVAGQVIIPAPGSGQQLWIYGVLALADATAAGTVQLKASDGTNITGPLSLGAGGFVLPVTPNVALPWFKVATNKALEADTGACTVDGVIVYATVSV